MLSTKEVARFIGVNEKMVYSLVAEKGLPATKITGKWLFPRHLVEQWIEANTINFPDTPAPPRPGEGLLIAQTMAFGTLSISELIRAYTSRSERYSLLQIGIFSNKWMQYAVLTSLAILLAIIYVPFLQAIFNTVALSWTEWRVMVPLILLPAVATEITKVFLRMPRLQGWLHPMAAPTMLGYANPRPEEPQVAVE